MIRFGEVVLERTPFEDGKLYVSCRIMCLSEVLGEWGDSAFPGLVTDNQWSWILFPNACSASPTLLLHVIR